MTDEASQPAAAPRIKRPYVRRNVRQEEVRQEPTREVPVRAHGKVRQRRGAFQNIYGIPLDILDRIWNEYGADLQWNLDTVKGMDGTEVHNLPTQVTRIGMEQQGWESVQPGDFGGLLDGMFTKKDHRGEIVVGGQVLQWRPCELTLEARAEDREMARAQIGAHEKQIASGNLPGVDHKVLNPRHGSAQSVTKITKTRVPTIPVPQ